ncbi:hypothetical protein RHMOL_Rhmol11G0108300 [Rhododendron molle]|uniref:Uncharacterized protein n=1 Tax=Rhododendron molle TaxID=49168 RepID=A0ACC0LRQ0_RHOML|nr:hypothetical protein RHMOL_Rhmol11G0108300 [Rhododendron molle]
MDCYDYHAQKQEQYDSPMPWIGVYIAAASLVCSVAMAGDVIYGIRRKKLWFPCKFFTMNAASLTVLTVATKLPVDLTTAMWGRIDRIAKLSSTIFVITVMGNFLTSFAFMDNNAILMNIAALGILVITIIVDACIQMVTSAIDDSIWPEEIFVISSMLFLFVALSFSVLTVPTTKRYLELKYDELHKTISNGGKLEGTEKLIDLKLKEMVKKYWVMAETSNPQFVMARSVTCTTTGIMCLLIALTLVEAEIRMNSLYWRVCGSTGSNYRWSTSWILWIQFCGVVVGTVAPTFRWFTAISYNCIQLLGDNHQNELIFVENYWMQMLVEWKERPLPLRIRGVKFRKLVEDTKFLALNICIGVQFGIVAASRSVLLISIISTLPFFSCCYYGKRLNMKLISIFAAKSIYVSSGPETSSTELDLSDYILQLEGEVKLPTRILKNVCHDVNRVIQKGRSQKPKYLIELLQKSSDNFEAIASFDHSQVQNCWTLPVVNLTSIAFALPNIENHRVARLISSVSEGLSYANLVEESLSTKGDDFLSIKHAADVVWKGIELYGKWLDKDFRKLALEGKTTYEFLQTLGDIAEKTAIKFQRNITGSSKVLVATSMRRICQTISKDYENSTDAHTDENLFEQLSIMIADILGACLTNLPRVIALKCYCSAVEEREKSVRHAASLVGETEEIREILRCHQLPSLSVDRAAYIDEWCAFMKQKDPPAIVGSSNNEIAASGESHLAVDE